MRPTWPHVGPGSFAIKSIYMYKHGEGDHDCAIGWIYGIVWVLIMGFDELIFDKNSNIPFRGLIS